MLSYIFKHFIKITIVTNECKAVYRGCCCADLVATAEGSSFLRTWIFIRAFYFLLQRLCRSSCSSPHLRCLCANLFGFWRTKICFSSFFWGGEVERQWTLSYAFLCRDCSWWSLGQNPSWTAPARLTMIKNDSYDEQGRQANVKFCWVSLSYLFSPTQGLIPL